MELLADRARASGRNVRYSRELWSLECKTCGCCELSQSETGRILSSVLRHPVSGSRRSASHVQALWVFPTFNNSHWALRKRRAWRPFVAIMPFKLENSRKLSLSYVRTATLPWINTLTPRNPRKVSQAQYINHLSHPNLLSIGSIRTSKGNRAACKQKASRGIGGQFALLLHGCLPPHTGTIHWHVRTHQSRG